MRITLFNLIEDWAKYNPPKESSERLADDWRFCTAYYKSLSDGKKINITYEGKKKPLTMEMLFDMATKIVKERIKRKFVFHPREMKPKSLEFYSKIIQRLQKEGFIKLEEKGGVLKDFEYLLHRVEFDEKGKEEIHHCYVYDHIANLFEQDHLLVKNGKAYLNNKEIKNGLFHIIKNLESNQEVVWSDEESKENKIRPKQMRAGMTLKQKAKEW